MSKRLAPSSASAVSAIALGHEPAQGARPRLAAQLAGDSASDSALKRLNAAIAEMKVLAAEPFFRRCVEAIRAEEPQEAAELALAGLQQDEANGFGWYLLAIAREKAADFKSALQCYETALKLIPDHAEVANDLGRLAYRLGMKDVAEQLFAHYLARHPDSHEAANNLACTLRDQGRHGDAIEVLRAAINGRPDDPLLWNTLATVLNDQGEPAQALTFYDEALRIDPAFAKARYNRGNAKLILGDIDGALADCLDAIPHVKAAPDLAMMKLASATIGLCTGTIGPNWDAYEARLDPHYVDATHFIVDRPAWTPDSDLRSKRFLLVGEQGLGDEVLFANLIPDLLEAVGPKGRLHIAVEPRLIPLFSQSFPAAAVTAHATYTVEGHTVRTVPDVDLSTIDLWAPMASPLRRFRRDLASYPDRPRFLAPDAGRVAHWRDALRAAPAGLKIGVLWKSLKLDSGRLRFYSPFEAWASVLHTPGCAFVNLQYGDCAAEIAEAEQRLGVKIWSPPGIDLKDDLADVGALSCALDLVIGPANATTNIAAACGAPVWFISTPGAWTRLGTERYPWYPQARVFLPPAYNEWAPVMADVANALGEFAGEAGTQA